MTLQEWISEVGPREVARRLGVSRQAVYYWLRGRSRPGLWNAQRIERMSGGRVRFERLSRRTK